MSINNKNENIITETDLIISLLALSNSRTLLIDQVLVVPKLKDFFNKKYKRLPKLSFRIIDNIEYCEIYNNTLLELQLSGMLLVQNPMFHYYAITDSLELHFKKNIEPLLTSEEINYLIDAANNICVRK